MTKVKLAINAEMTASVMELGLAPELDGAKVLLELKLLLLLLVKKPPKRRIRPRLLLRRKTAQTRIIDLTRVVVERGVRITATAMGLGTALGVVGEGAAKEFLGRGLRLLRRTAKTLIIDLTRVLVSPGAQITVTAMELGFAPRVGGQGIA